MPRLPTVLLVEDDPAVGEAVAGLLSQRGFAPRWARTAGEAMALMDQDPADVVILDLGLPDRDGLELLDELRRDHRAPVLILTARSGSRDKVGGLERGADDYLVKPFDPEELVARIRALLRRAGRLPTAPLTLGPLVLDASQRLLRCQERQVALTGREVELLEALASVPGKVWTRSQLLDTVWGYDAEVDDRAVDTAVKRLRRKMAQVLPPDVREGDPRWPRIRTLYGVGYCLEGLRW
jgi:DNA-binding response OmpR family regulator